MIECSIVNFFISIEVLWLYFWYKEIKNQLIYQDFTAVFVKYTNTEGFAETVITYVNATPGASNGANTL